MSYVSFLKSNVELPPFKESPGRNTRMGIMPDNIEISYESFPDPKSQFKYNYIMYFEEFDLFHHYKSKSHQRLIFQITNLITSLNQNGNKVILETIWDSKSVDGHSSYRQIVDYSKLNETMFSLFFSLEDFDYRSIEIIY